MKKYSYPIIVVIILGIIALVAYWQSGNWVIIAVAVIICLFLFLWRKGRPETAITEGPKTLQDLITQYGEPDDIIVTDVTRANEIDGALLVYDKGGKNGKGYFICEGDVIDKENITDITFHNKFGTAFSLPDDFQIVISTNNENQPKIHLRAGNDVDMVQDIIMQMKAHLPKK